MELALEKAEKYGRASKEELEAGRYQEQGRQMAVQYLKDGGDLEAELARLPREAQTPARLAVKEVLLRNVVLPRNGEPDPRLQQALDGLLLAALNKKAMARQKAEVEQLLQNFLQIRNSAHQQLKARYSAGLSNVQRAMEAQMRARVRVEPEQLPQFQEEWRQFLNNLQQQFEPLLEDCKRRMLQL
jgi:hypothetical protein